MKARRQVLCRSIAKGLPQLTLNRIVVRYQHKVIMGLVAETDDRAGTGAVGKLPPCGRVKILLAKAVGSTVNLTFHLRKLCGSHDAKSGSVESSWSCHA